MTDVADDSPTPRILAAFLVIAGALGWWASFALTLDKFAVLADPNANLDCNISPLVQCGANLSSWQGEVFGFPNPLLGIAGFVAPIAVGVAIFAGARFARWFWIAFNVGVAGAFAFVIWLIAQSIFSLGTLCPWCMLVWSVTIPLFWAVTLRNAAAGAFGSGLRPVGLALQPWVIPITLICFAAVALLAQVHLDVWRGLTA